MHDQHQPNPDAAPPRAESRQSGAPGGQANLYRSEQWLRMLIDSAEDYAIFAVTPQGKICTWNKGAERLFGYTEPEIQGQDFAVIFTPEDRASGAPQDEVNRALREGYSPDERWHLRKDGSRLFVSGAVRPLRDTAQNVLGFLKVAHDITGKKHTAEYEALYRALFESVPGQFLVLTPRDFRIVAVSDAYLRATMTEREAVVGQRLFDVFPDEPGNAKCDGATKLAASLERVVRERRRDVMPVQYYPVRRPASQGGGFEERWWSPVNTPVLGAQGEVTHIIHRVEDVTGLVRRLLAEGSAVRDPTGSEVRLQEMAEEVVLRGEELKLVNQELRRNRSELARAKTDLELRVEERTQRLAEKVAELEAFSYSLSHDMRAPLRAMRSFAQILCRDFSERVGPEGVGLLERIATAAGRLDQLIEEVLTLSRISRQDVELRRVELDRFLGALLQERPALRRPGVSIELAAPLLPVMGHEALLSQCFSNLLDNAVKFVAPGTSPRVRIRTEAKGGCVRVWIEDNGIGVAPEDGERIFGMFQRLHGGESYPGTGIGLAIVRKAVERMGGKAGVESQPGQGSRFWLELPRA